MSNRLLPYLQIFLALITLVSFTGCKSCNPTPQPQQLVTSHTEMNNQPSADDDLVDHCFKQESTKSAQKDSNSPTKSVVLSISMPSVSDNDIKNVDVKLINLNSVTSSKILSYVDRIDTSQRRRTSDGRIEIKIVDSHEGIVLDNHLGPGPYMAVITAPSGVAKDSQKPDTLFYYYETYAKDVSDCSKYRE